MTLEEITKKTDEIDGWFSADQQRTVYPITQLLKPRPLIMEIGTYRGKSTLFYSLSRPDALVITNDICNYPWTTEFDPAGFRLQNNPIDERVLKSGNVLQIVGRSSEVVKTFNLPVDLLFIDGHHIFEEVKKDIEDWGKFVVPGGYIIFHDYDLAHPEVVEASKEYTQKLKPISTSSLLGIFQKPEQ